jgi:Endonuclease/Exonuclease/phosphatase family
MNTQTTMTDMELEGESLRPESSYKDTGEERQDAKSRFRHNEAIGSKPLGRPKADEAGLENCSFSLRKLHNIATWNVRSMYEGKLTIVLNEMTRLKINILGISELRWKGGGHFQSGEFKIIFSGNETSKKNGVALICDKNSAKALIGYDLISDRIITARFNSVPVRTSVIQAYAPTATTAEDEVEEFYEKLQETLDTMPKGDIVLVMGDFNAKVGEGTDGGIVGRHGLGERNVAGDKLVEFCAENELMISNTWFQLPKRRLYTWTSPDGKHRNQIDYLLVKKRWQSSVCAVKTLPGADCGSDHELLTASVKVKLKHLIEIRDFTKQSTTLVKYLQSIR